MKTLIIPEESKEYITLGEITPDYKGIILVYSNYNFIGFIYYYDTTWTFSDSINTENDSPYDSNLIDLIKTIKKDYCNVTFKVEEVKKECLIN